MNQRKPFPAKLDPLLVYMALGEAIGRTNKYNAGVRPIGKEYRIGPDSWTTAKLDSETHDPLDASVILVQEKNYYVDRDNLETQEYVSTIRDLLKNWSFPGVKPKKKK